MADVTILYMLGWGRSGGTLLGQLLGGLPGFVYAGEIGNAWAWSERAQCSCGAAGPMCPFWSRVFQRALGGWPDLERVLAAHGRWAKLRHTSPLLLGHRTGETEAYGDMLARVYGAVAETAGAQIVVDSTRRPPEGLLLLRRPGFDVRFLHLVRDPRAVAYSWSKRPKERPEGGRLPLHSPTTSTLHWVAWNMASEVIRRCRRGALLRYEDLVLEPGAQLRRVLRKLGLTAPADLEERVSRVPPGTAFHVLVGNPVRAAREPRPIEPDEEWRVRQPPHERVLIALATWPLLLRYGYARRSAPPDA